MDGGSFRVGGMGGTIANTTNEAAAFYYDVDMGGHEEFNAAAEGVDIDFFVLGNRGLAQIHTYATAESIEPGTMEGLAAIDILIAAIVYRTADTLAVLTDG